jgi:hypothetical protein
MAGRKARRAVFAPLSRPSTSLSAEWIEDVDARRNTGHVAGIMGAKHVNPGCN